MRPVLLEKTPKAVVKSLEQLYRVAGIPLFPRKKSSIWAGTDGARLSVRGLPCPERFHRRVELSQRL